MSSVSDVDCKGDISCISSRLLVWGCCLPRLTAPGSQRRRVWNKPQLSVLVKPDSTAGLVLLLGVLYCPAV